MDKCVYDKDPNAPFKHGAALECPECLGHNITMQGKNLLGEGVNKTFCADCGFTCIQREAQP